MNTDKDADKLRHAAELVSGPGKDAKSSSVMPLLKRPMPIRRQPSLILAKGGPERATGKHGRLTLEPMVRDRR